MVLVRKAFQDSCFFFFFLRQLWKIRELSFHREGKIAQQRTSFSENVKLGTSTSFIRFHKALTRELLCSCQQTKAIQVFCCGTALKATVAKVQVQVVWSQSML